MRRPYFGYFVVGALFFAEIAVTGISFYSFSLFIRAWQTDPDINWTLTQINTTYSVGIILAVTSPFIGRVVDRQGPKIVMLSGVPLIALSLFLQAFMTEVWHLWVLQGMLFIGQSAAFLGTGKLVGMWFSRDRGRMMGIALAGNNAGGMVMAPLMAALIGSIGWRLTLGICGIGLLIANFVIILLFIRDKPEQVIPEAQRVGRTREAEAAAGLLAARAAQNDGGGETASSGLQQAQAIQWRDGLRTPAFWLIAISFVASFTSIFAVLNQLGKHLEIVGIDLRSAGLALSVLGFFGLLGKLIFGYLSEKIASRYSFAVVSLLQVLGIIVLMLWVTGPNRAAGLWPFALVYGIGFGAVGALMPLVMTDTFGIVAYGTIFGVMQVFLRLANASVPVAVGYSVEQSGTYTLAFLGTIASLVIGTIAVALARPPRFASAQADPRPAVGPVAH